MSISIKKGRDWLNENSVIVTIVAVVGLILVLAYLVNQARGPNYSVEYKPRPVWFYDLNTGETFELTSDVIPPVETDSGLYEGRPAGVLKRTFSCDECKSDMQSYLFAYLADAQEARRELDDLMRRQGEQTPEDWHRIQTLQDRVNEGAIVSRADKIFWYAQRSPEGREMTMQIEYHCEDGGRAQECFPGK